MRRSAALGGADFIHVFGGNDSNDQASPVGDGIAEERAPMRAWVRVEIEGDPGDKNRTGNDAQRVVAKKRLSACSHRNSDDGCSFRVGRNHESGAVRAMRKTQTDQR